MRIVVTTLLFLLSIGSVAGEPLVVGDFQLALAKGFTVLPVDEGGRVLIRTPTWSPVTAVPLARGPSANWETVALEYLLEEYKRADARILPQEVPQEISIKREGPWTTIYWTYGGTKAYFGMYWGGQVPDQQALLFWASPTKSPGRSQYQALSEVTKGVVVTQG